MVYATSLSAQPGSDGWKPRRKDVGSVAEGAVGAQQPGQAGPSIAMAQAQALEATTLAAMRQQAAPGLVLQLQAGHLGCSRSTGCHD